ncbi:MAG TPA: SDR family oxidoreductase [Burkholderiales bacterium]|nr:SDR family oxidoreductase [Burkholderiales bacterium]
MQTYEEQLGRIEARPRRWLVTGAAGFIGSHLAERLLALGQEVVALDNLSTGRLENLAQVRAAVGEARWRKLRFIEGDIRRLDTCREACRGVERVLHQAALGSVPRSIDDPIATTDNNVNGFVNMLVAARDAGVARFVYASSSAVYGDHPVLPRSEPQTGSAVSPYGLSKYVNELYAAVFARCYGFPGIGLRYFNVFGPRQNPDGAYASVIPAWAGALLRGRTAYVNGDGSFSRDFCHVDNVVQGNLLAAMVEDPHALDQAYNIALGGETTLNELFEMIVPLLARYVPGLAGARPVHREVRKGDVAFTRADIGRARRLLGFEPAVSVAEGLASTLDWYAGHLGVRSGQTRSLAHV